MKSLLIKAPLFLPLVVVFFCLNGTVENYGAINLKDVFFIGLSLSLVPLIFFCVSYFFSKDYKIASLISVYLSVCYLFFGSIQDFIKHYPWIAFVGKYSILMPIIFCFLVLLVIILKKRNELKLKFFLYLNILFIVYILIDSVTFFFKPPLSFNNKEINFDFKKVTSKPDVYFLLFDGYPGKMTLRKYFQYEDSSLSNFLQKNNFLSLPISSNYNITHNSMSSIFNMDYISLGPTVTLDAELIERQKRFKEIQQASAFDIFQTLGYEIENNSIFDIKNIASENNKNEFLLGQGLLLTDKLFFNRLNRDMGTIVPLKIIKYLSFLENKSIYRVRNGNISAEKNLINSSLKIHRKPVLNYSHFMMPHPPFFFDSIGNKINFLEKFDKKNNNGSDFLSYLKYTNKVIESVITNIRNHKPNAIIILMSDHGFRGGTSEQFITIEKKETFNNICAVYFPNNRYGKTLDTITNVNIFKYLFNNQYSQNLAFLKDSCY